MIYSTDTPFWLGTLKMIPTNKQANIFFCKMLFQICPKKSRSSPSASDDVSVFCGICVLTVATCAYMLKTI